MNKAEDIFAAGALTVAKGESHTTGERQFRVSIDGVGRTVRLSVKQAKTMAEEVLFWVGQSESKAEP